MINLTNEKAKDIIKKYGTGYYRATFLFPKNIREATWIYYQFVRVVDELVDVQESKNTKTELLKCKEEWQKAQNKESSIPLFNQYKAITDSYAIPLQYTEDFFDAMEQDLTTTSYQTYAELEKYMHGSAVVVGYTMSHIIGFEEGALPHAKALGEAFQMTNFLRDIRDDYEKLGRIYIPKEDMDRFGVTAQSIANHIVDEKWRALMKFEIARTRALYEKGLKGVHMLEGGGRRAVYAAMLIYKEILDKIEKNNYDIFTKRIVVSPMRKKMLLYKSIWKRNL